MALWEITMQDGTTWEVESDTEPTEADLQAYLNEAPQEEVVEEQPVDNTGWTGDAKAFLGSALSSLSWGASDLGYRALAGADAAEAQRQVREANPVYSALGTIAGFVPGLVAGPVSWAASLATKAATKFVAKKAGEAGMKRLAQAATGKVATTGTKIVAEGLLGEAQFQVQQTAEKLAGTRDFTEGNNFLQGAAFSIAADLAFRGAGKAVSPAYKAVMNVVSKKHKAVNAMGGVENVKRAQRDYVKALEDGRSAEEAEGIFTASLMQGMPDESRALYQHLVQKDPELAKFARQQMAGGGQLVIETASALTSQQYKKFSREILENLFGPDYKNMLGTTETDFSKEGLLDLLGLSSKSAGMEARKQALARAEEKVMANPSLAKQVHDNFSAATSELMITGSRDLQRAASMVEPGSIKSYAGSDAYQEAVQMADEAINRTAEQLAETGQQITQAQINDITMQAHRAGAQKHFKTIIAEGTDSVQDINDIKNFFEAIDAPAVKAGQKEAFGAFNQRVNTTILDGLDPIIYESNQALRYGKTLTAMHEFGESFEPTQIKTLASKLDDGLSAEEKAMKLAAFKMGILKQMNDAVIAGKREKVEQIGKMIRSSGSLGKYFDLDEVKQYMDAIRPKAEAAYNLDKILHASGKFTGNQGLIAPLVRFVTGIFTGARQQYNNAAITLLQRGTYGAGTSKMIREFSQNPTSANLNRVIKSASDLTERMQVARSLADAFDAVTDTQTMVRGMRDLQER